MAGAAIPIVLGAVEEAPKIISIVTGIVHGIEALFGKGNGSAKKQAALDASQGIVSAYGTVTGLFKPGANVPDPTAVATDIGNVIDAIVKLNNDLGIFKH